MQRLKLIRQQHDKHTLTFHLLRVAAAYPPPQIIGVDNGLFVVDIAVLVAMYFAACVFVIGTLAWRHRVRNG